MTKALARDLKKLSTRAFDREEWAEGVLRRYHAVVSKRGATATQSLRVLYHWMFVPPTLWPFNIQDVLADCLAVLEKGRRLNPDWLLLIELLPKPPEEAVCSAVAIHERNVQSGDYELLVSTPAKYAQNALAIAANPELRSQWDQIKARFNTKACCDYKGVIRRTMNVERNLRPAFSVKTRRRSELFQAVFDAFCLRWNIYGMLRDEPLPLKLTVNITPHGTMIHIPAYWSFDPKRDIRWSAIAKLHRIRVRGRQGLALAEGFAERMRDAEKLRELDKEVLRLGLKGEKKHAFLCAGLGWVRDTSPKRIARLRAEFHAK
jgi:hypothetical protein